MPAVDQEDTLPCKLTLDRAKILCPDSWKQLCQHRWDGMVHILTAPVLRVGRWKDGQDSGPSALRRLKSFHILEGFLRWEFTSMGPICCLSCSPLPQHI